MKNEKGQPGGYALILTQADRRHIANLVPELGERLFLSSTSKRTIHFTKPELYKIKRLAGKSIATATSGSLRHSIRHILEQVTVAIDNAAVVAAIPASDQAYQFRITLADIKPPIWRRIQVGNCTLDKFHEHIQTAMGWTNSHLHQFEIGPLLYGDPALMEEDFVSYMNSMRTMLNEILPAKKKKFEIFYEYDFGDSWRHRIEFEGIHQIEEGVKLPCCIGGARACPPEDVGGSFGYQDLLKALADPNHEEHMAYRRWIGRKFDAEKFHLTIATRRMQKGLPDWRKRQ